MLKNKMFIIYTKRNKISRRYIIINDKFKTYARYLMEQHFGRALEKNEHVHHKDKNVLNNMIYI